ncbi:hypothetical protein [Paraburkholderia ferrariae]|uniref:Uncharacterized protein n=1 Tax=Paraburkholderia ferrariae TaxID=386056 RepID=A0ABU9RYE4_9BURK
MTSLAQRWRPARAEWDRICDEDCAALGLKGGEYSWANFNRKHTAALVEAGIARRGPNRGRGGTVVVDTTRFAAAVFDLLTLGRIENEAAQPLAASAPQPEQQGAA